MRGFLVRWLVNALALIVVVYTIRGIEVESLFATVVAALILGILNTFFRPLIILFTFPLSMATLGGFLLVINGGLLWMVSKIVKGFVIHSFWAAFWGALLFSVASFLLNLWINQQGRLEIRIIPLPARATEGGPFGERGPFGPRSGGGIIRRHGS